MGQTGSFVGHCSVVPYHGNIDPQLDPAGTISLRPNDGLVRHIGPFVGSTGAVLHSVAVFLGKL